MLARCLPLGGRIVDGVWYRAASWTALAPLRLAQLVTSAAGLRTADGDVSFAAAILCPVLAMALCVALVAALGRSRRRVLAVAIVGAAALFAAVSSAGLAMQLRDVVIAEQVFASLATRGGWSVLRPDAGAVGDARAFLHAHPDSRWTSEAWRVLAADASARGRDEEAAEAWRSFRGCFRDPIAPGVAYAEYSRGLCEERLGCSGEARRCYQAAIAVIRARRDGVQSWIAVESARRLATLDRATGMVATADYWTSKSVTFADVYSIQ